MGNLQLKEKLKNKIKDQTAAYAILAAICVTFAINIGIYWYIGQINVEKTNANIDISQIGKNEIESTNTQEENINGLLENTIVDEEESKKKNEEEYEELKKANKISSDTPKYYIKVNYGAQTVTIYTKDSKGNYTVPVKAMICSTGTYTPTSGVYRTLAKGNWWPLYGDVYGQYATHIVDGILFHSVPYLKSGDRSSLEWWAYDQLGQRVSMGCVRLTVADAKWIYDNCKIGTQVEFYSSSNPGPLGKPSARKISDAPENIRGWDPTDPNKDNPWKKYLADKESENTSKPTNPTNPDKPQEEEPVVNEIVNEIINEVVNEVINGVNEINDINEIVNSLDEEMSSNITV